MGLARPLATGAARSRRSPAAGSVGPEEGQDEAEEEEEEPEEAEEDEEAEFEWRLEADAEPDESLEGFRRRSPAPALLASCCCFCCCSGSECDDAVLVSSCQPADVEQPADLAEASEPDCCCCGGGSQIGCDVIASFLICLITAVAL